eukprot:1160278-Pelagomonas_calceolata.AAC.6
MLGKISATAWGGVGIPAGAYPLLRREDNAANIKYAACIWPQVRPAHYKGRAGDKLGTPSLLEFRVPPVFWMQWYHERLKGDNEYAFFHEVPCA